MSEMVKNVANNIGNNTNRFLSNVAKLIDVKSLVTLSLTACFIYMNIVNEKVPQEFNNIYLMIIGFYFGTQAMKKNES